MTPNERFQRMVKLSITKLILQETGTYNEQFIRPYETSGDGMAVNYIQNRIEEVGIENITPGVLSGISHNFIQPAATHQGTIELANGWNNRRIRFLMEVTAEFNMGSLMIYYIQGYTNYPGVTMSGNVAPDMEFIINSYVAVNRSMVPTPTGMQQMDVVRESSQLMADNNYMSPLQGSHLYAMRPVDIFSGMQMQYLGEGYSSIGQGNLSDARTMLRRDAVLSRRSNNVPASYLARTISGFNTGRGMVNWSPDSNDVLRSAKEQVLEPVPYENPFLRAIGDIRSVGIGRSFSYGDLQSIDPNVNNTTVFVVQGNTQGSVNPIHQAGMTENWNGSDLMTKYACMLSQSVPSIMMELMITELHFRSTNASIGGLVETIITGANSLSNADMTQHYELFKRRLEREVVPDITFNNQDTYMLDMSVDLFGDTWINLSINGSTPTPFVTPSFCDNLLAPIVTPNHGYYNKIVHDFDRLVNAVTDTSSSDNLNTMAVNKL